MKINALTASKIKDIRKKLGFTAESIAHDLGISKTAYSQLENGHVEITLARLEALAQLWSVPLSDLMPGNDANSQVSNGSGDNINSGSKTVNNYYSYSEDKILAMIETLNIVTEELKKYARS